MGGNEKILSQRNFYWISLLNVMIFVTVGTQRQPFARLFSEIIKLVENGDITEEIVCQTGTYDLNHPKIKSFKYLPYIEMVEYINKADLIISHGGTGSIVPTIKHNKKVIGIPRLVKFHEHLNDHQKDLIDELSEAGYIIPLYDVSNLLSAIKKSREFTPKPFISGRDEVIEDLKNYIENNS